MQYESLMMAPWAHGAFWVFVALIIFLALFGRKIVGPILAALDRRADGVREALDEAARLKAEAEAMLRDAKKRRADALAEAKDILDRAREEAARTAAELTAEAELRATARERMVQERIDAARASAIAEVRETAVDVAIAAATEALAQGFSAESDAGLIDRAIAEVPAAFTRRAAA